MSKGARVAPGAKSWSERTAVPLRTFTFKPASVLVPVKSGTEKGQAANVSLDATSTPRTRMAQLRAQISELQAIMPGQAKALTLLRDLVTKLAASHLPNVSTQGPPNPRVGEPKPSHQHATQASSASVGLKNLPR